MIVQSGLGWQDKNKVRQTERKFSGYEEPYTKIHYELDFSRVAKVDIGCGTAVVGNGAKDLATPNTEFTHPNSMYRLSHQWPGSAASGFFPQRCARDHSFEVTIIACSSAS